MTKRRNRPTMADPVAVCLEMLTYCRPAGSRAERQFRARWLDTLPGAWTDPYGNVRVDIGGDTLGVLWSCHTDTVHRQQGRQRLTYDPRSNIVKLPKDSRSNCLGADDTIGVWLCREMILAGVPGSYVFHYGEERGGIGSSALAEDDPEWIGQHAAAIALDRAGQTDVVTHQFGQRTCSDRFAASLGSILADAGGPCLTATQGVYTDTAEYAGLIPECTNVSVGYQGQHGLQEFADLGYASRLRAALIAAKWERLIIDRVPGEDDLVTVDDIPWTWDWQG